IGQVQVRWDFRLRTPENSFAVARAVVGVDVHVKLLLPRDDRRVDQSGSRDLVPHISGQRILAEIIGNGSARLGDGRFHLGRKSRLYGNVDWGYGDFLPGGAKHDTRRFGVKPPVKFATGIYRSGIDSTFVGI